MDGENQLNKKLPLKVITSMKSFVYYCHKMKLNWLSQHRRHLETLNSLMTYLCRLNDLTWKVSYVIIINQSELCVVEN